METNFKNTNPLAPKAEYSRKTKVLSDGKKANIFFNPILKIVILLVLCVTICKAEGSKTCKRVSFNLLTGTGGSIVVIDDFIVEVTTNDGSTIQSIQVYSGSTLEYGAKGCNLTTCEYNLGSLSAGSYEVYVHTSTGTFSGAVSIK